MSFFQMLCPAPPLLFHALFLSPIWTYNVAYTIFWGDNQKMVGLWEGNAVKYPIPREIWAFISHVSYNI